jgi:hypothetical protein
MRVISLVVILGVTLLALPTTAAAQAQVVPPFAKLFRPQSSSLLKPAPRLSRPTAKVVCGMTIVPVDSSLDSKIRHPVPSGRTKYTLRIHQPPVCRQ